MTTPQTSPELIGQPEALAFERRFELSGQLWRVYEETRSANRYIGPSLIFESAKFARRVFHYPVDWGTLSDEELFALSWSR